MKSLCKYYQQGYCKHGKSCEDLHVDNTHHRHLHLRNSDDYCDYSYYHHHMQSDHCRERSSRSNSTNELSVSGKKDICQKFLIGQCHDHKCSLIHDVSIKYKEENNKEFISKYTTIVNDFTVLEPYERKIFANATLDVMFIMDCTGSMGIWINEAKKQLKNIISYIIENNPYSKVRMSFVGYRDFSDANKPEGQYVSMNFTEDIESLKEFIAQVTAIGGGDEPEDVAGGLALALKMNWKSTARYAVLVCDAPCHGDKYHANVLDLYSTGDPEGNEIEKLITQFVQNNITLYCVEINDSTKIMFNIMSEVYKSLTQKDVHIEKLGKSSDKFGFFVALSASVTLGAMTYSKFKLHEIVSGFRADALETISKKYGINSEADITEGLLNGFENLELEEHEQKTFDFITRMNNLNINDESENKENKENKENEMIDDTDENILLKYPQDDSLLSQARFIPKNWDEISPKAYKCICHTWFFKKDRNTNIDWRNPLIQKSQITSTLKISSEPFSKGSTRYEFYLYDTFLNQKLIGKLPFKIQSNDYTLEKLSKDIDSLIVCQGIASEFNDRIVNYIPFTSLLINFVPSYVYEITDTDYESRFKYISAENYIEGKYEKYNDNIGWVNEDLTDSSLIAHAFSHFSWQITQGYMMIVDLQGFGGILTEPQIHSLNQKKFGKGNLGYYGIMRFFLTHYCNEYCKKLELVHPRNKVNINPVEYSFFVEKYDFPNNKEEKIFKLCDLCKKPYKDYSEVIYDKKTTGQETYCNECNTMRKQTEIGGVCVDCHAPFKSSQYWFKMKRTDFPVRCTECRLENRNCLRSSEKMKEC